MTKTFEPQKFNIGELNGISKKTIEEHLKLYGGYVTHTNTILKKIEELAVSAEENMGLISGLQRRLGFEFDGMRNHEYYFTHLEGGASELSNASGLKKAIAEEWGSFEIWLNYFKTLATTRGVGWAMLYYDPVTEKLINAWVDEQHFGHLTGLSPILALDMWEHSYLLDYVPSEKKKYIDAFFANLNWQSAEQNFADATR